MPKPSRKRFGSKHRQCYTILCEWCGDRRETAREDTKTCGDRCRARLANYTKRMGYPPDGIVGPLTTSNAVDKEIDRLILQERRRRAAAAAELAAFLARKPLAGEF